MPGLVCSLGVFLVHVLADGAEDLSPSLGFLCWELAAPCMLGPAVSDESGVGTQRGSHQGQEGDALWPSRMLRLPGSSLVATRTSGLQPAGEVGPRAGDVICWEERPAPGSLRAHRVDSCPRHLVLRFLTMPSYETQGTI